MYPLLTSWQKVLCPRMFQTERSSGNILIHWDFLSIAKIVFWIETNLSCSLIVREDFGALWVKHAILQDAHICGVQDKTVGGVPIRIGVQLRTWCSKVWTCWKQKWPYFQCHFSSSFGTDGRFWLCFYEKCGNILACKCSKSHNCKCDYLTRLQDCRFMIFKFEWYLTWKCQSSSLGTHEPALFS